MNNNFLTALRKFLKDYMDIFPRIVVYIRAAASELGIMAKFTNSPRISSLEPLKSFFRRLSVYLPQAWSAGARDVTVAVAGPSYYLLSYIPSRVLDGVVVVASGV